MFNNLIGKNKELGRFLFCERYTLPPVKNAMYIAEGQDLKRGAVVDVNGVLVGTNSLMPYAVLEFDCDTRSGGKEASVFVKGEFNFDKLHFADGLEKSDLDNIVYNGSGIGIVIKPYAFDKEFSPKSNDGGGYKQVNLTFNQSDSKTIPVGQKEEVHATCTMKANDVVKIQLAEDCTDAVLVLIRQNNIAPANVKVFRGTTNLLFYGCNIITGVNVEYSSSARQVLLSTNYIEGDHGSGYYDIPTSFNDTALAGESDFVGSVSVNNLYQKLNAYGGGTFIFEIKGDVVICLPN